VHFTFTSELSKDTHKFQIMLKIMGQHHEDRTYPCWWDSILYLWGLKIRLKIILEGKEKLSHASVVSIQHAKGAGRQKKEHAKDEESTS